MMKKLMLILGLGLVLGGCGEVKNEVNDLIQVFDVNENQVISSPVKIEGRTRGYWLFEADFPIKVEDENGEILGIGIGMATEDWMTEDWVNWEVELEFEKGSAKKGRLIFEKDNPSDLPENSAELVIPVRFE